MAGTPDVKYLVFDCESVADGDAILATRYPQSELTPAEAIAQFRQDLLAESGRDFIPYTYHLPVAVVVAKVRADFSLNEIKSLDHPQFRPHVITDHFWKGWEGYDKPTLITFNGRSFDIPLLELAAFRFGISLKSWFNVNATAYQQMRNRYNIASHLDLHEMLTNFGSTWFRGGLNLAARLVNKPGKMDVQGDMVQQLYSHGKLDEINEYCRCDVLDTYFVFLRTRVLIGELTISEEQELVAKAKQMLIEQADEHPAYTRYLENWGDWTALPK
jgi:predicted PolB exonuclease-like 3'-5' exonuclease